MSMSNRDPNFRQLGEQQTFMGQKNLDFATTIRLDRLLPRAVGLSIPLTITKVSLGDDPLYLDQTDILGSGIGGLRKPKDDLTTYSLTIRRSTPMSGGMFGDFVNNLSATSSYVTGVDRTEFQDGATHTFALSLDYLLTSDSARTLGLFRWNPTQFRLTSGVVSGTDHRTSFITPSGEAVDRPSLTTAQSRLWRNASVLEFRPANGLNARWEVESIRDLRDYGDTSAFAQDATGLRRSLFGMDAGFERERSLVTSISWSPLFSSWFRPRTDIGTQYDMLRDPNVVAQSTVALPGVIGVDSVLAARDSTALLVPNGIPRRMTAAQTASVGTTIDVASAFKAYTGDSSAVRRVGGFFAPMDVSYTRSLLSSVDASMLDAPLGLQFGLGGPTAFRSVGGTDATTAGQTGTFTAGGSLLLPWGAALINRYRRTSTLNWIARPDSTQAEVNGDQTTFPDAALRWGFRPAPGSGPVSNVSADVGYQRSVATVTLPSLFDDTPPELRRTHQESFPIGGAVDWSLTGGLSTGARYTFTRRVDSLPGSIARSHVNELSLDAGRAFRLPDAIAGGIGLRNAVRTRVGFQSTHTTTFVLGDGSTLEAGCRTTDARRST